MEYTVIYENNIKELIIKVNQALKDGWKPLGGIMVDDDNWCYQAMLKERQ